MDFLAGLLEPFHWQFMRNALLAVLVISPLFGLLSTMVVTSRMSFFSDALGHSAFTGIAIGTLCGLADPLWMAVLLAAVFALLFTYVRRKSNMASDTVIGVFSSTAVALGIFIATFGGGSFTQYNSLLIGDILSVEPAKIALLAVILLVAVAFGNITTALYGIIAQVVSAYVTDAVLYGLDTAKVAYIISNFDREISEAIVQRMDRGVTILKGEGAYSGDKKRVLMCAFKQKEIVSLKELIFDVDPNAFIIVCNAHEVTGNGFKTYQKNEI